MRRGGARWGKVGQGGTKWGEAGRGVRRWGGTGQCEATWARWGKARRDKTRQGEVAWSCDAGRGLPDASCVKVDVSHGEARVGAFCDETSHTRFARCVLRFVGPYVCYALEHSNHTFRNLCQWRHGLVFLSKLQNRLGCVTLHGGRYFLTSTTRAQMSEQGINNPDQVCFGIASWHVLSGRLAHVCIRPHYTSLAACAALCFRNGAWGLRAFAAVRKP